jgi:biopolymer transport protein ExbB/TolQ
VQQALGTATSCERINLEDKLALLSELGRLALLIGILGSLFDVLALGSPSESLPAQEVAVGRLRASMMIAALSPVIGGLLVAVPAWLARSMLNVHVQRIVLECEFIAQLVSSHLAVAEQAKTASPIQHLKLNRVAA